MRLQILRWFFILLLSKLPGQLSACGNSYYFSDMPLPVKNGFVDYYKLLIHTGDSSQREISYGREHFPAYLFPVGMATSSYATKEYRDKEYMALRDTLVKMAGSPAKSWKFSDLELAKKILAAKGDYKLLSDFAWKMARQNEVADAEKLLVLLEQQHPDEYNIIANLGTVYELLNKPAKALQYITKAVMLSPQSHYGSEWLHLNILRMKTGALDPYDFTRFFGMNLAGPLYSDHLYSSSIQPEQFGNVTRDTLMIHLAYQLHERMYFIKKEDPVIAEMLYMFIQCMIHRGDYAYVAEAGELYTMYAPAYRQRRLFDAIGYCLKAK